MANEVFVGTITTEPVKGRTGTPYKFNFLGDEDDREIAMAWFDDGLMRVLKLRKNHRVEAKGYWTEYNGKDEFRITDISHM